MKSFLSIFFLFFCLSALVAQEKHFVFIQSDNNQPFYVSLNGKLFSSTARGYVIIPKLADGSYSCSIGFAKNAFPEQGFEFVIDKKDIGFNLKNFGEKGWGLFNLQSLNVTMAGGTGTGEVTKALNEKAAPKDDLEPLISFDRKKTDTAVATKTIADTLSDEQAVTNEKPSEQEVKPDNTISNRDSEGATANVEKVSETSEKDGVHLSYTEKNGKNKDTIHVTIPSVASTADTGSSVSSSGGVGADDSAVSPKPTLSEAAPPAKDSLQFLDVTNGKSKKESVESVAARDNVTITNSKCKNIASDDDYGRLRKKMAMETSDEKMINVATKIYRNKCFTTSQIRKLSTLFLSDEGRYNFFNASYNSAADASEYSTLQSEFIDPTFANRFKAMLQ